MEIWGCMGKISQLKDDIEEEEIKHRMLREYFQDDSPMRMSMMSNIYNSESTLEWFES